MAGGPGRGNLPAELTSFVGRRRELGEVRRRLSESRLVTLTGVGGTGKTRLAMQAAARLRRAFPDGVWFVDLSQLHGSGPVTRQVQDPDVLPMLVAGVLGLSERGAGPPLEMLVERLDGRQMLLVLDNCEHLIPASAMVTDGLLRGCPRLRVLATSREPLTVAGEVLFEVPPLPVPDPRQLPGPAEVNRYESVVLFLARAEKVVPGFGPAEGSHRAVAELCRRLDGLPLAIELAAAWVRVLTPEQILDRLADQFALLSRGHRDAPDRQQTLRACVDWSFDLCTKPERALWARLSVFADGFSLDAIEGVCAGEDLPEADVLDVLTGLLDKSILVRDDPQRGSGQPARYRMLETIREYGQDRLRQAGEDAVLRRRHRDWYEQLAGRTDAEWVGPRQAYWAVRLAREFANVRAAVEFCLAEPGEAEGAIRIVANLPRGFWWSHGAVGEGLDWLDRALAQVTAPTALRARGLVTAAGLSCHRGNLDTMTRRLAEGEGLARRLPDSFALALAAYIRAQAAVLRDDPAGAVDAAERGLAILSDGPGPEVALRLHLLLQIVVAAGRTDDHDRVRHCFQEILETTEPRGEVAARTYAMWGLGLAAWHAGDDRRADDQVREGLRIQLAAGVQSAYIAALLLEVLAWIAARRQRHRRAATFLGVADAVLAERAHSISYHQMLITDHAACTQQARDALGDAAFIDAFRHGRALRLDDAVRYALDERRGTTPPLPSERSTPLTRREGQIAELIAQGLSNKEIAHTLVISQRTAESHVQHILTKLCVTNRTQIAAWVTKPDPP
jgi:predicted ATPase/DNA-binding NarL/FixJ family response regulator